MGYAHTRAWMAGSGGLWVQSQPWLHTETLPQKQNKHVRVTTFSSAEIRITYQALVTALSCHQALTVAVASLRITRIPTRNCSQRIASTCYMKKQNKTKGSKETQTEWVSPKLRFSLRIAASMGTASLREFPTQTYIYNHTGLQHLSRRSLLYKHHSALPPRAICTDTDQQWDPQKNQCTHHRSRHSQNQLGHRYMLGRTSPGYTH